MNILLFSAEQIQADATVLIQDQRQLQHINQVLKLKTGDDIKVGLKNGIKGQAKIIKLSEQSLVLAPPQLQIEPPKKMPLMLILALPRPKSLKRIIADCTSLGVEHILLLNSERVEKSYWNSPVLEQIDQFIQLGLEQAGDTIAPKIQFEKRFRPFVEDRLSLLNQSRQLYVAHPYAQSPLPTAQTNACTLMIGPEGGWNNFELKLLAKNNANIVHAGDRILRTETACISISSRLMSALR